MDTTRKLLLALLILTTLFCGAAEGQLGQYYPPDDIIISPYYRELEDTNDIPLIEVTGGQSPVTELKYWITITYSRIAGAPVLVEFAHTLALLSTILFGGSLTILAVRNPSSGKPGKRAGVLYFVIQDHPGITVSELKTITAYSRSSLIYHLHCLEAAGKIRKIPRDETHYSYARTDSENESVEFMRKILAQEKPHKIFKAIMDTPGISQKDLVEATGIPQTTLQWHLSELLNHQAIEIMRRKNSACYTVLPEYLWLYHYLTKSPRKDGS